MRNSVKQGMSLFELGTLAAGGAAVLESTNDTTRKYGTWDIICSQCNKNNIRYYIIAAVRAAFLDKSWH